MSILDTFVERNREFAAQAVGGRHIDAFAAGRNAQRKSNDHRVRGYAGRSCSRAGNRTR
jgi:hypothetical protein